MTSSTSQVRWPSHPAACSPPPYSPQGASRGRMSIADRPQTWLCARHHPCAAPCEVQQTTPARAVAQRGVALWWCALKRPQPIWLSAQNQQGLLVLSAPPHAYGFPRPEPMQPWQMASRRKLRTAQDQLSVMLSREPVALWAAPEHAPQRLHGLRFERPAPQPVVFACCSEHEPQQYLPPTAPQSTCLPHQAQLFVRPKLSAPLPESQTHCQGIRSASGLPAS
mmetsp:Transcript_35543/g.81435  ORF Transcript_35543/g.81435 Transcript_35543/m.81435 type:complete len:223 (-) Transcript_35543:4719-5387(-)